MRYCFIVNTVAASGDCKKKFMALEALLQAQEVDYVTRYTDHAGHARELAKRAVEEGFSCVVAVGGDGTLHEIAQVLAGTEVSLGILPFGTGNDFVKALHLPGDPAQALKVVLSGKAARLDTAKFNGQTYLNVAGFGFDVDVLLKTEHYKKAFHNKTAYLLGLLHALIHLRPYSIQAKVNGETIETDALILVAGNGRFIGGGMDAVPLADTTDGLLDVCIIKAVPFFRVPKVLLRFLKGKHLDLSDTIYLKTDRIEVACTPPCRAQLDGELYGMTPAAFEIVPGSLKVIVAEN